MGKGDEVETMNDLLVRRGEDGIRGYREGFLAGMEASARECDRHKFSVIAEVIREAKHRLWGANPQKAPKSTDADFNRFRHRETGQVVEAWQWWPGKSWGWTRLAGWHAGVWLADPCGPDEMAYGPGLFSDTYEPIHPERKRLQSLCDEINAQPGMPALCPELLAARADGRVVDTNSGFYVKDREPEKPAEEAICAECEHQAITPAIPACLVGQIPPEARDWVTGGYNEDYGIPIDGKWRPYCNIVNTDGRCPNFKGKD